jgi:hypothetical protein
MIDNFNLPNNDKNVQSFYGIGSAVWQTWQKPNGCKFMQMIVIGGGGGGGAGATSIAGSARSGGAGGGASAISRAFGTLSTIPDTLYILVGMGGTGGLPTAGAGGNGTVGTLSYVSVQPNTTTSNIILASGAAAAGAGNGGAVGSSNATAGSAGTVFLQTAGFLSYNFLVSLIAGQLGGSGGNQNQSGTAVSLTNIVSGGAGGAGVSTTSRVGANVTGSGFVSTINGGNPTNPSEADSGFSSYNEQLINMPYNLFFTGGAGGYANNTTAGGIGGNGAYGSGGGGGGAGTTGGSGGNGGNGLVIITCW